MALPALAVALGAGVATFLASKAGHILAGLGLAFIYATGITAIFNALWDVVNIATGGAAAATFTAYGQSFPIGAWLLGAASTAGFFQAVNIIVSAYMAKASMWGLKQLVGLRALA